MDLNSLKDTVSNLTLYDLKAGVRKVQNAVMNYTEMEAKVREATNNEPWGTSSSLMQEIANGTFNYQTLNETMPMIYKRFTEKSAEEWRQIYKALQLLEFLIKNGSERVIDDARSHLSLLKMLRQFHFIDQNGKDQGINVRNRSKELVELLSDVDKIRQERKKARSNRSKYGGYEGGAGLGSGGLGMGGSSSRYGGFGSESGSAEFGGYSGGVYGDGGGFGGQTSDYQDTQLRRDKFEEYDEYDEGTAAPGRRKADSVSSPSSVKRGPKKEPAKPKEPEVDLFDFGDEPATTSTSNGKAPAAGAMPDFGAMQSIAADDDDFDDFQSATPAGAPAKPAASNAFSIPPPASTSTTTSATQFAAPKPVSGTQNQNINDLFASVSPPPRTGSTTSSAFTPLSPPTTTPSSTQAPMGFQNKPPQPTGYQASGPNYFQSVQVIATPPQGQSSTSTPLSMASLGKPASTTGARPAAGGDAFASLLGGAAAKKNAPTKGATMADMARQKASAGIWGAGPAAGSAPTPQAAQPQQGGQKIGGGLDDLLG